MAQCIGPTPFHNIRAPAMSPFPRRVQSILITFDNMRNERAHTCHCMADSRKKAMPWGHKLLMPRRGPMSEYCQSEAL